MMDAHLVKVRELVKLSINSRGVLEQETTILRFKDDCYDYKIKLSGDKETITHYTRNRILNSKWSERSFRSDSDQTRPLLDWVESELGQDGEVFLRNLDQVLDKTLDIKRSDSIEFIHSVKEEPLYPKEYNLELVAKLLIKTYLSLVL